MAKQEFSIPALMNRVRTESDAYELLEELRWGNEPVCPHCGVIGSHYYLKPANGVSRKTRTKSVSERRVWKCKACRKQFTVLVGTIFHGSKISIRTWVLVVLEMCASKNGVSAREVERKYDLTPKTAWFMLHRIREAMRREPMAGLIRGTIVADETWIGGEPKNWHADKRTARANPKREGRITTHTDKRPIMALVDFETREVRSKAVADVTAATLAQAITEQVDIENSALWTDESASYRTVGSEFASHHTVNHKAGEYKRNGASTNLAEGYFSQLKRSVDGTHHHVSVEHLDRYLAQHDFLYSNCRATDSDRMRLLMSQAGGRRLTYKPLTEQG